MNASIVGFPLRKKEKPNIQDARIRNSNATLSMIMRMHFYTGNCLRAIIPSVNRECFMELAVRSTNASDQ